MDQKNGVYIYSGILLTLKKEGDSDVCYKMNEPWVCCAEWNDQSQKDQYSVSAFIRGA